jgi:hypothetical protein
MIFFHEWAKRHNVSPGAMAELQSIMGGVSTDPEHQQKNDHKSEAGVSNDVRLEAGAKGVRLMRNNVGACLDSNTGRLIRYGLANESKQMNQNIKSSDLIGIKPVLIVPSMVGGTIGQFVARETKRRGWKFSANDDRAVAQLRFMNLVVSLGGDACFASDSGTF